MPFRIQRSPRLLNNLLSIFGGETPVDLEDRIRGTLDLLQVYGAPQRRLLTGSDAALTEGTALGIGPPDINDLQKAGAYLLYGASMTVTQTGTLTALSTNIILGVPPAGYAVQSVEFTQFGATVTGGKRNSWYAPYPILLPSTILPSCNASIIGTDANVAAGFAVDVALLGS